MAKEFEVKGLKEMERLLRKLPDRVAANALASALRAGGRPIIRQARKNLGGTNSAIAQTLKTKVLRKRGKGIRAALVGAGVSKRRNKATGETVTRDGWYAHIVEFGTLASRTRPLSSKTKRKKHKSPLPRGLKSKPFLRPAFDTTKSASLNAISKKLWANIKKELRGGVLR